MRLTKLIKKYRTPLFIIALAFYFFWFRERSPITSAKSYDLFFGFLTMAYFAFTGFLDTLRYNSFQLQLPTMHYSLGQAPTQFNDHGIDYHMFRLGGYNFAFMSSFGNDGVVITPSDFVFNQGQEYTVIALPVEVPLKDLPLKAQSYINYWRLDPPYFYAMTPAHLAGLDHFKIPSVDKLFTEYEQKIKSQASTISMQKAIIDGDLDTINKFGSVASYWSQSFNKPTSIKERILGPKQ